MAVAVTSCNKDGDDEPATPTTFTPRLAQLTSVVYDPAPGQFVNEIPRYESGDTKATMSAKALESLNKGNLISLGGFGGSVTVVLASPITYDASAEGDFRVLGNAYLTGSFNGFQLSSSEPGTVWVAETAEGPWYELRGEEYDSERLTTVTYTPVSEPTADRWVDWSIDNGFGEGCFTCNVGFHDHSYFPQWIGDRPMTFGTRMVPVNSFVDLTTGLIRQYAYKGYADSYPNDSEGSVLSIADAVDADGNRVKINKVKAIKIVSAVLDTNGPLGETSTEVGGIQLLHN